MSTLPLQINERADWVSQNNMKLNPNKTKSKEIRVYFSSFDVGALPPITEINKLLGVIISENLK